MGRNVVLWLPAVLALVPLPGWAQTQIQLSCGGAVVEARGSTELKRPTQRLRFSLALEAEEPSSDRALASLQRRLAEVRRRLQALQVSDLQVTSPSTWKRPASQGLPEVVQASLQVSGQLAPAQLQPLVREVGACPACVRPP